MSEVSDEWGQREWNEAHFPEEQLDTVGDTWGFRWRGMERWRHARTLALLQPTLQAAGRKEILEIGCALCDFTVRAWELNRENHFCGLDSVPAAVDWASRKYPQFELKVGAIPAIPFDRKFDVILCMEVLCYLDADGRRETIRNIHDSLTPGGTMLFSGVLDGGVRHHSSEEVLGLIGERFQVTKVMYNHWSLYRRFVEVPFDSVHSRLERIRERLELPEDDFARLRSAGGGLTAKMVGGLRKFGPLSRGAVSGMMKGADFMRRRPSLAAVGHGLERLARSNESADEIVVVARKAEDSTASAA